MSNFIKKHLFSIIICTMPLVASNNKRNDVLANLNYRNAKILKENNLNYVKASCLYPQDIAFPDTICIEQSKAYAAKNEDRMIYLRDMIARAYVIPLVIGNSSHPRYAERQDPTNLHVYSYEDLFKGDFIGEFSGDLTLEVCKQPEYVHESIMSYKKQPDKKIIIDASSNCNELRFIKRSKTGYNCKRVNVIGDGGFAHIIYVASRYINEQEELILQDECLKN